MFASVFTRTSDEEIIYFMCTHVSREVDIYTSNFEENPERRGLHITEKMPAPTARVRTEDTVPVMRNDAGGQG